MKSIYPDITDSIDSMYAVDNKKNDVGDYSKIYVRDYPKIYSVYKMIFFWQVIFMLNDPKVGLDVNSLQFIVTYLGTFWTSVVWIHLYVCDFNVTEYIFNTFSDIFSYYYYGDGDGDGSFVGNKSDISKTPKPKTYIKRFRSRSINIDTIKGFDKSLRGFKIVKEED